MMKHEHIQKKLLRFLEGDLPEDEKQKIARHVQQCRACQRDLELLDRLWQAEQPIARIPPPPFLWTRLQQRRQEERAGVAFPLRKLAPRFVRPALATLALIFALFAGQRVGQELATSRLASETSAIRTAEVRDEFGMDYFEVMPPGAVGRTVLAFSTNDNEVQR